MNVNGRIWLFGDDVNTDLIIPGRYLDNYDPSHLAAHAMEGANKEFASKVSPGDIVIAGRNFGCGSSREQAVTALKQSGVSAVIARSFARIFYRNAINLGLYVLECDDADSVFSDGETAMLDIDAHTMCSDDGSRRVNLTEIPNHAKKIIDSGGLIPHLKSQIGKRDH
ncbi:MAG: 3-isopropylmalate dehydratase [Candidatus Thermoplasmatota archaeon]|nr:3-isopropylmalate dehydratase [Candidatus Thermoplasmatota archaeon]